MYALALLTILGFVPPTYVQDGANLFDGRSVLVSDNTVTIGLVTTNRLYTDPKTTALQAMQDWGMGPHSFLMLISMNPKKLWLQPGRDFAQVLDQQTASAITRQGVPYMQSGDYSGAVNVMVRGALQVVRQVEAQSAPTLQYVYYPSPGRTGSTAAAAALPVSASATPIAATTAPYHWTGGDTLLLFIAITVVLIFALAFARRRRWLWWDVSGFDSTPYVAPLRSPRTVFVPDSPVFAEPFSPVIVEPTPVVVEPAPSGGGGSSWGSDFSSSSDSGGGGSDFGSSDFGGSGGGGSDFGGGGGSDGGGGSSW